MMKSKFLLVAITFMMLAAIVAGCVGQSPAPMPKRIERSDSQITIVLDNVIRAGLMPADIAEKLSSSGTKVPTPSQGNDFVCVYLRIARIEDIHVVDLFGYADETLILLDNQNHEYKPIKGQVQPTILVGESFFTASVEVPEGATGFLVFELPKQQKPAKLLFVYSFKRTWEDKTANRGQIEINL